MKMQPPIIQGMSLRSCGVMVSSFVVSPFIGLSSRGFNPFATSQYPEAARNSLAGPPEAGCNDRPMSLLRDHINKLSVVFFSPRSDQKSFSLIDDLLVRHAAFPRWSLKRDGE